MLPVAAFCTGKVVAAISRPPGITSMFCPLWLPQNASSTVFVSISSSLFTHMSQTGWGPGASPAIVADK